jgi:competence ComEA-like helix-hairpin-helix protein
MPHTHDLRLVVCCLLVGGSGLLVSHQRAEALARDVRAQAGSASDAADLTVQQRAVDSAMRARGRAPQDEPATIASIEARWQSRWFGDRPVRDSTPDPRPRARTRPRATPRHAGGSTITVPIDMDRASMEEIERLPRVGAALAARIVDYRARCGPFGSLEGLDAVSGIGPALLRTIAGSVTFSASPRPSHAPGCAGSTH